MPRQESIDFVREVLASDGRDPDTCTNIEQLAEDFERRLDEVFDPARDAATDLGTMPPFDRDSITYVPIELSDPKPAATRREGDGDD